MVRPPPCVLLAHVGLSARFTTVGLAFHQKKPIKAYEIVGSALDPRSQVTKNVLTVKELLAPLSREEVGLVRCLGLNYADHAVSNTYVPFYARF